MGYIVTKGDVVSQHFVFLLEYCFPIHKINLCKDSFN